MPTEADSDEEEDYEISEPPAQISLEELQRAQEDDPFCLSIRQRLNEGEDLPFVDSPSSGILKRHFGDEDRYVIPTSLQPRLLALAHSSLVSNATPPILLAGPVGRVRPPTSPRPRDPVHLEQESP